MCPRSSRIRADPPRRGSKAKMVPAVLRQMKFELMSMKSNRHQPFFRFGGLLENFNFSLPEIDAELSDVAGKDPKMIKKKNDFLKRVTKNRSRNLA